MTEGMYSQRFSFVLGVLLVHALSVCGTNCNWHFYDYYEQKGCTPVLGEDGCPVRFQCRELSEEDLKTCVNNGKIYKEGETIQDLGPCHRCSCRVYEDSAYINCAAFDCFKWRPDNESCYMGHKPGYCCPVEMCPNENEKMSKTCKHNEKEYKIGDYIEVEEPCKYCYCTEEWTGEDGPGCSEVNCLNGINVNEIREGCIPIYYENRCCPIEMYCDGIYGATPVAPVDEDKDDYCHYKGRYYEKGSIAFLETYNFPCTECTCTTPPDFTCVRRRTCAPESRE